LFFVLTFEWQWPMAVIGLGSLCFDYRSSMEPEPGRCRRTDGKKWRCSRDVVQGHKYCERHVHRGRSRSRKPVEGGATSASTPAAPAQNGGITAPPCGLGFSPAAARAT
jgi:hypothetical protein